MKFGISLAVAASLALALSSANAALVSTNDLAAWEQSTDNGTWTAAERGFGSYGADLNGEFVNGLWVDGVGEGQTIYFRTNFSLASVPASHLWVYVDDDVVLKINGQTVITDTSGVTTQFDNIDITSYLHAGNNTFHATVISYFAPGRTFIATTDVLAAPIPEPESVLFLASGLGVAGWLVRRRRAVRRS